MTKIVSINNNKGGVLKTTTALSIASVLSKKYDKRVLIIDLDAQSNISTAFGINAENLDSSVFKLLVNKYKKNEYRELVKQTIIPNVYNAIDDLVADKVKIAKKYKNQMAFLSAIKKPSKKSQKKIVLLERQIQIIFKEIEILKMENPNLGHIDILPSNSGLITFEYKILADDHKMISKRLKVLVDFLKGEGYYDYIIIDSPPALSLIQSNIFEVTDQVVIPLELEYYSIKGLTRMIEIIHEFKKKRNPSIELAVIIPVKVNTRSKLHKDVYAKLKLSLLNRDDNSIDSLIPFENGVTTSIQDATAIAYSGKPLLLTKNFDKLKDSDKPSKAYLNLVEKLIQKETTN